ncbi:MAG: hypothetical protein AAGI88_18200, partial [Pseudomonadota bacterium]
MASIVCLSQLFLPNQLLAGEAGTQANSMTPVVELRSAHHDNVRLSPEARDESSTVSEVLGQLRGNRRGERFDISVIGGGSVTEYSQYNGAIELQTETRGFLDIDTVW